VTSCGEARPPASGPALDDAPRYRTLIEQLPLVVYVDALDALDAESSNIFTSRQVEPLLAPRSPSGLQTPACSCARSIPTIAIACSRRTRTPTGRTSR